MQGAAAQGQQGSPLVVQVWREEQVRLSGQSAEAMGSRHEHAPQVRCLTPTCRVTPVNACKNSSDSCMHVSLFCAGYHPCSARKTELKAGSLCLFRHAMANAAGGGGDHHPSRWERLSNFGLGGGNGRAPSTPGSSSSGSGGGSPGSSNGAGKPQPAFRLGRRGGSPPHRDDGGAFPADGRGAAPRRPPATGQRRRGGRGGEEDAGLPELPRLPRDLGRRAGLEDWDDLGDWGEPIPGETDWANNNGDAAGGGARRKRRRGSQGIAAL